jgi:hypothetical protein
VVEKISVQIALEGTEEIKRQLAGISEAGQRAFADISAAAAKAGGFDRLDPTLVAKKFSEFGITATAEINKITRALETAGKTEVAVTGVQRLEQGVSRLATTTQKANTIFGLTRREIGELGKILRDIDLGPLGAQFTTLSRVGLSFGEIGIAVTAFAVALAAAAAALAKFASEASETEKALTELQKTTGASFQNLSSLQQVFAAGGTPLKQFATEFGNLSEKIAAAGQARLTRIFGAKSDYVQWANDLQNITNKFDNLAAGGRAAFSPLTTQAIKLQAVLESLSKVRTPEEQWARLANIFQNLSSDIERAQLGKALGLSPETIATLSQGAAAIKAMQAEAQRLGLTLTTQNQQALQQMIAGWNQFTALVSAAVQKIGAAAAPAFAQFLETAKQTLAEIVLDFQTLPLDQAIANLGQRLAPAFEAIWSIISPIITRIGNVLGAAFGDAVVESAKLALGKLLDAIEAAPRQAISLMINAGINLGNAIVDGIVKAIQSAAGRIWEAIKQALGFGGGGLVGGGEETGLPMASGGMVGGRGSGTSDSNLAWLSRGEFVVPARAVAQPGVLALLEKLRRGALDGFAMGGLVPSMARIPAFADGGMVGTRRSLNLTIEGQSFTGLSIPESTAQALERFAVHSQLASTGRKPSWRR